MFGTIVLILFLGLIGVGVYAFYQKLKGNLESDEDKELFIPTTQDNLPIDYIRRGVVKLKNGSYAMVIKTPSINIDLMETSEREVVFSQYRQVLTAIDYPFQFLQQSRVVDIDDYIKNLEKIQRTTSNSFIGFQLEHYKNYMLNLVNSRSILTRKFYIVVPFDELKEKKTKSNNSGSPFDISFNKKNDKQDTAKTERESVIEEERNFETAFKQLQSRTSLLINAFGRFDIRPSLLNDEDLTELFYTSYNKNKSVYQPLRASQIKEKEYYNLYVKREGEK